MRIGILALATLLPLCAVYAQFRPTEDFFEEGSHPVPGRPVFSLSIRAAGGDHVMAGKPMMVEITLTNISKANIYIADISPYLAYIWDVGCPDGKPCPLSGDGVDYLRNKDKPLIARNMPTLLRPGESQKIIAGANLLFDSWQVGMYTVQVRRKISPDLGGGEVESNKIVFTTTYNPITDRIAGQATKKPSQGSPKDSKDR